ncbi:MULTISPECIES: hypothetical protein [unclassified Duganella]|uniref:hypothetical protein n=1 Tax=unclassified Duganella TaxID=2636909 RepID=UPI00102A4F90|nr:MULTISPECIES: hypothetical protein [unclassified Duganella]
MKRPDPRETRRLAALLDNQDCPAAVQEVKDGIKARQPDVLMMAAAMMEDGVCMKANWEKAVSLYEMAYQAGSPTAWHAMVAALAAPGRDNGRALWFAAQRSYGLPGSCTPKADPLKQPDAFNDELERMPPEVFRACVYMAGVMSEVFGRTQYPPASLAYRMQGNLAMKFVPSSGVITWIFEQTADSSPGNRDMSKAQFHDERKIEKELLNYVKAKSDFALARYTRPEGIDPALVLSGEFRFTID